jgi:hypothetical protein
MSAIPFHSPLITKRSLFAGLRIKYLVQKNDLIQMGLCLQLHLKPALSPPQAKSPHGGVMCSHSAHLMQPCCDFFIDQLCIANTRQMPKQELCLRERGKKEFKKIEEI